MPSDRTLGLLRFFVLVPTMALAGCFEVENGPAFSGGDEVPGLDTTLHTVGQISPSEGPGVQPASPGDIETWYVRRALNGSYIFTQDGDEDEEMIVRPRHIEDGDYVIEYSSAADENWLGVLNADGQGDDRRFTFCISLDWDDEDIVALAPEHDVRAHDATYGGITVGADDPDNLFAFMADLRSRSELGDWECTVMGVGPSPAASRKNNAKD